MGLPLLQEIKWELPYRVQGLGLWMGTSVFRVEVLMVGCEDGFCMLAESAGLT